MKKRYEANVDPSNQESLRRFFDEHYDYTTLELRLKYDIPTSTLNYWRRKVGKSKTRPKAFKNYRKDPIKVETISDSKTWDNGPWFKEMYVNRKLGAYLIARMIQRSVTIVYRRLNKYGIELRPHRESVKPRNEFHDKDWLWQNYVYHHRTVNDLAKEAGVCYYTICNWLVEFGIPIRDASAYSVIKNRRERIEKYKQRNGTSLSKAQGTTN